MTSPSRLNYKCSTIRKWKDIYIIRILDNDIAKTSNFKYQYLKSDRFSQDTVVKFILNGSHVTWCCPQKISCQTGSQCHRHVKTLPKGAIQTTYYVLYHLIGVFLTMPWIHVYGKIAPFHIFEFFFPWVFVVWPKDF